MKKIFKFSDIHKSMLIVFIGLCLFGFGHQAKAQDITDSTPWIWKGGDTIVAQIGHYGTKGVPSTMNIPTARNQAASWTDNAGNFWMFGGRYFGTGVTEAVMNDLWRYNPSTQEWTWISGDSTFNGSAVVGTQGVASVNNTPSARSLTGYWKDNVGNLWVYGGAAMSTGTTNDLWKFDPVALTWTFVKGDALLNNVIGVYGTMGLADNANKPGSRSAVTGWADDAGNLWLFGGQGYASTGSTGVALSDLWKYSIANNNWTWIGGSNISTSASNVGNYGTKGIEAATNYPSGRAWSVNWVDGSGVFWMMGGLGYAATASQGVLNDLWRYNPVTNLWTWMNGANVINHPGLYISKGVGSVDRTPKSRFSSTTWVDKGGDLWMFGGTTINWQNTYANDIWRYNIASNEWTWVKGDSISNVQPVYNTLNVPSLTNEIGARGVKISWRENANNNVWIFGGQSIVGTSVNARNDLWKIQACSPIGTLNEITGLDTVCAGDSLMLSANLANGNTYLWDFPATWGSQQTGNSISVLPDVNGTISVRVIGNCGDTSNLQSKLITVEIIAVPSITQSQGVPNVISVPNTYATYQWFKDGLAIAGADSSSYVPTENGNYSVTVTSTFGCEISSASFHFIGTNSINTLATKAAVSVYPNPVLDKVSITISIAAKGRIVGISGEEYFVQNLKIGQNEIDLSTLSSGLYFIEFRTLDGLYISTSKLIKK